jgi:hypothetical protein
MISYFDCICASLSPVQLMLSSFNFDLSVMYYFLLQAPHCSLYRVSIIYVSYETRLLSRYRFSLSPHFFRIAALIRGIFTMGQRNKLKIYTYYTKLLDVRVTDTDAKSYSKRDPAKVLESQEKEKKKRKHLEACLERRRHFTPFCLLNGWHARTRGQNLRQMSSCQARQQMGEVLFTSLWIRQCSTDIDIHNLNTDDAVRASRPVLANQIVTTPQCSL